MKAQVLLIALLALLALPLQVLAAGAPPPGQRVPFVELSANGRYVHLEGGLDGGGWGADVAFNFTDFFALAGEVGGVYGRHHGVSWNLHDFTIGPRITFLRSPVDVYVHGLAGGYVAHASGCCSSGNFELAAGGGVDLNINPLLSWRIVQGDYLGLAGGGWTSGFRLQTGLLFKF
jgi:hypothetical protein